MGAPTISIYGVNQILQNNARVSMYVHKAKAYTPDRILTKGLKGVGREHKVGPICRTVIPGTLSYNRCRK